MASCLGKDLSSLISKGQAHSRSPSKSDHVSHLTKDIHVRASEESKKKQSRRKPAAQETEKVHDLEEKNSERWG